MRNQKNASHYYDYNFLEFDLSEAKIDREKKGLNAFLDFLPIKKVHISLGEGNTPLTYAKALSQKYRNHIYIKHEHLNPTGSFKDRESLVAINYLLEQKKDHPKVCIASSGNAAVSLAAYARLAKMNCTCFVPKHTSMGKKELIALFGATCKEIEGNYEQVYRYLADQQDRFGLNLTAGIDPVRIEGNKTIAYELFQDNMLPDYIVVPCGNGGNLAGIWKGFKDLQEKELISKIPCMIAVQIKNAAPLAQAIKQQQDFTIVKNIPDSIAEGIVAEESYCSPKAVKAIIDSQGFVVEVTDDQIRKSMSETIKNESLLLEPTSYAAFAALERLSKKITKKKIVVIATGSGLKTIEETKLFNHS